MVYRMGLTYDEFVDILDVKCITGSTIGYTTPPGLYEITDIKIMLKSLLPKMAKVKNTVEDIRLMTNLGTNKTIRLTKKIFFYTILGFIESHAKSLCVIERLIQLITGSYKSEKHYRN